MPRRPAEGQPYLSRVSRCLSATGIRFLSIPSRRGVVPLSRSAYQHKTVERFSSWTRTGFPRSTHTTHDRIGCPLNPETTRCSSDRCWDLGRRAPPLPGARSYHPGPHPITGVHHHEASSRVHSRPPARSSPQPGVPWMEQRPLSTFPRASHPADQGPVTHAGWETGDRALARSYMIGTADLLFMQLNRHVRHRVAPHRWW
jgi:hypothetical protein